MNRDSRSVEVLVVGAGPAGLAAACRASEGGKQVLLLDDNSALGGQIWRQDAAIPARGEAARWLDRLARTGVKTVAGTRVIAGDLRERLILAESAECVTEMRFEKLVLVCGARELFLPFSGWTLSNVMGAGGLQAMVKGGLPIEGKRVVVAGSGPLLLAVAAYLRKRGAKIALIAEQAPWRALVRFAMGLAGFPGKVAQSAGLRFGLRGVPYMPGCWIEEATGDEKLEGVRLRRGSRQWEEPCDYLATGYGLRPNSELAALLGCLVEDGTTVVDDLQQTTIAGIYSAGEMTGIGGVELSILEGQIAGLAAAGRDDEAIALAAAGKRVRRFAELLDRAFRLRAEIKNLANGSTIICRCEDVTLARVLEFNSWRAAKLQTRCGMGACQGRICAAAAEVLFDWRIDSVRPPVFPARVRSLMEENTI